MSCDWAVKDNDNESNSQLCTCSIHRKLVVIGLSKIMIMKAIHNRWVYSCHLLEVAIGLSKIMIH